MAIGSQLTLYVNRSQKKGSQSAVDWILDTAKALGLHGATVMECSEGVDVRGHLHAARFFELADEPAMVVIVADDPSVDALVAALEPGRVKLFYTRTPLQFGHIGDD